MILINGHKIQLLCDKFIATTDNLNFNPYITTMHPKAMDITTLNEPYDNPRLIYCCTTDLLLLKEKLHLFQNPFILISHNSDENIVDNDDYLYIANYPKIIKWYTQNLLLNHEKAKMLPIGIANPQWEHGNEQLIINAFNNSSNKTNEIYFYNNINTNYDKRNDCYMKLKDIIPFTEKKAVGDYFNYLATFKFGICPEGNGIDTHRLWECFYLKVVPIVIDNPFNRIVKEVYGLPIVILKDWSDLKELLPNLDYNNYVESFINIEKIDLDYLKAEIFKDIL